MDSTLAEIARRKFALGASVSQYVVSTRHAGRTGEGACKQNDCVMSPLASREALMTPLRCARTAPCPGAHPPALDSACAVLLVVLDAADMFCRAVREQAIKSSMGDRHLSGSVGYSRQYASVAVLSPPQLRVATPSTT